MEILAIIPSYSNISYCTNTPQPVLQDSAAQQVWSTWGAGPWDLFIIDSAGQTNAIFNLYSYDLNYPSNREIITQALLDAAQVTDSDGDQLPDDWEMQYFGYLNAGPAMDSDGDGSDNWTEFAFGTDPTNPASMVALHPELKTVGQEKFLSLTFRRRAGSWVNYIVETSTDLVHWTSSPDAVAQTRPPVNLYDGTGMAEVSYSLTRSFTNAASAFLKVRAVVGSAQ